MTASIYFQSFQQFYANFCLSLIKLFPVIVNLHLSSKTSPTFFGFYYQVTKLTYVYEKLKYLFINLLINLKTL